MVDVSGGTSVILSIAGTLVAILSAWFLVARFISPFAKRVNKWITTWEQFMEDWSGIPARDGRDRVPGVMERLNDIDGELKHNGGSSVKDAIARIETGMIRIDNRLIEGEDRFDQIEKRLDNLEK